MPFDPTTIPRLQLRLTGIPGTQDHLIPAFTVQTIEFHLKGEYVRLCDLLKLTGIAESGGQGKHLVAAGEVKVDGQPESRKSAKIRAGQIVECRGVKVVVRIG